MPRYPPRVSPIYYVGALGHLSLANYLISKRPQDLQVKDEQGCTPLHMAVLAGHVFPFLEAVLPVLYGGGNSEGWAARYGGGGELGRVKG
jgi:ankyrin repeat protein